HQSPLRLHRPEFASLPPLLALKKKLPRLSLVPASVLRPGRPEGVQLGAQSPPCLVWRVATPSLPQPVRYQPRPVLRPRLGSSGALPIAPNAALEALPCEPDLSAACQLP